MAALAHIRRDAPGLYQCGIYAIERDAPGRWTVQATGPGTLGDGRVGTFPTLRFAAYICSGEPVAAEAVPASIARLMEEARRRFESFAVRDKKPLETAWLGLGFASEYAPAVDAGLMEFIGHYSPRCMGWLRLTERGRALYRALFPGSENGTARKYKDGLPIDPAER